MKHKNGARPAWDLGKGWHAEWDFKRGEIEIYDKNQRHQGAANPQTGVWREGSLEENREPTYKSVAMDALKAKSPDLQLQIETPEQMILAENNASSENNSVQESFADRFLKILSGIPSSPTSGVNSTAVPIESRKAYNKGNLKIAGYILIVMTAGEAAPVLRPILIP